MSAFNVCVYSYVLCCCFLTAHAHISAATVGTTPSTGKLFELLKETLLEYSLMYKQSQIYNCDESGMPLELKLPRVIAARGAKKIQQATKHKLLFLAVAVLLVRPFHPWLYLQKSILILISALVMFLEHCTACLILAGLTKSSFLIMFYDMWYQVAHYC